MATKTTPYDSAAYLRDDEDIALYLEEVLKDCTPELFVHALGVVARAKGMTKIAKETGLGRESLYKALSKGKSPSFSTVYKVMRVVGLGIGPMKATKKRPGSTAALRKEIAQ